MSFGTAPSCQAQSKYSLLWPPEIPTRDDRYAEINSPFGLGSALDLEEALQKLQDLQLDVDPKKWAVENPKLVDEMFPPREPTGEMKERWQEFFAKLQKGNFQEIIASWKNRLEEKSSRRGEDFARDWDRLPPETNDRLIRWVQDFLKEADNSDWGEILQRSPAWNRSLQDLENWVRDARFRQGGNGANPWWQRVNWDLNWKWGENQLDHLRNISLPRLPSLRRSLPWVPRFSLPRLGAPSLKNFSRPGNYQNLGWVLLALLSVVLLWFWWRSARTKTYKPALASLGPWPVAPEEINTRSELIRAFDYLALLTLGEQVRSWNHRQVADKLGEVDSDCAEAAQGLASLYEAARYTPGEEMLSEFDRDRVRRDLGILAGQGSV